MIIYTRLTCTVTFSHVTGSAPHLVQRLQEGGAVLVHVDYTDVGLGGGAEPSQ